LGEVFGIGSLDHDVGGDSAEEVDDPDRRAPFIGPRRHDGRAPTGFVADTFRHAAKPFNESELLACIRSAPARAAACESIITAAP
jgi:hypothetical protein